MPHELIKQRRAENRLWHRPPREVVGDLMQSEQLEMIDQERAGQNDHPAEQRQADQPAGHVCILDMPHHRRHRPPLPAQQRQRQRRKQHVGRALDRFRHEPRPPFLELAARHHAVLDRKQRHQQQVDDHGFRDADVSIHLDCNRRRAAYPRRVGKGVQHIVLEFLLFRAHLARVEVVRAAGKGSISIVLSAHFKNSP